MKNKVIYSLIMGAILSSSIIYNSYSAVCFLPDPKNCVGNETTSDDNIIIEEDCGPEYKYTKTLSMGKCSKCSVATSERYNKYACICIGGAIMNEKGTCECPQDRVWYSSTQKCECKSGYTEVGNGCVKEYNPATDTCKGYNMDYNATVSLDKNCWKCDMCSDANSMNFNKYKCYVQERAGYKYAEEKCQLITPEKDPCEGYSLVSKSSDNCYDCQECTVETSANYGKFMCMERILPGYELSGNKCVDKCESYTISPTQLQDYGSHCFTCSTCTVKGSPHDGFAKCQQKAQIDDGYEIENGKCVAITPKEVDIRIVADLYYTVSTAVGDSPKMYLPASSWSSKNNSTLNYNSSKRNYYHEPIKGNGGFSPEFNSGFTIGIHNDIKEYYCSAQGGILCSKNIKVTTKSHKVSNNINIPNKDQIMSMSSIYKDDNFNPSSDNVYKKYYNGYLTGSKPLATEVNGPLLAGLNKYEVVFPKVIIDKFEISEGSNVIGIIDVDSEVVLLEEEKNNKLILFPNNEKDFGKIGYSASFVKNGIKYNISIEDSTRVQKILLKYDTKEDKDTYKHWDAFCCIYDKYITTTKKEAKADIYGAKEVYYGDKRLSNQYSLMYIEGLGKETLEEISAREKTQLKILVNTDNGNKNVEILAKDHTCNKYGAFKEDKIFRKSVSNDINSGGGSLTLPDTGNGSLTLPDTGNGSRTITTGGNSNSNITINPDFNLPGGGGLKPLPGGGGLKPVKPTIDPIIKIIANCTRSEKHSSAPKPSNCTPSRGNTLCPTPLPDKGPDIL